jgi:iron complex outermembrane recepter protein
LFLAIIIAQPTWGQNLPCLESVTGTVLDEKTELPIQGATILMVSSKKQVVADKNGTFRMDKPCMQIEQLQITSVGFKPQIVEIKKNTSEKIKIRLKEDTNWLEEINVSAKRIPTLTNAEVTLEGKDLQQKSGESLAQTLSDIAGVSMIQTGNTIAKPVIQGMHSNRILTLNNGVRHEGQQWGNEHAPEIDPFLAKKIKIIKGAQGIRYGSDAIGGVIMIDSDDLKEVDSTKFEWNAVHMTNGRYVALSGIAEGKTKPLTWRVQATGKKAGNLHTPSYTLGNTGFQEFNFSSQIGYFKKRLEIEAFISQFNSKIGIFSGSHVGNISDLVEAIKRPKPLAIYSPNSFSYKIGNPYQDIQHNLSKIKTQVNLKNTESLLMTLGHQYNFRAEIDALRANKTTKQTFTLNTFTYELVYNHQPLAKKINGNIGINGLFQRNLTSGVIKLPTKSGVLIPNFENLNFGFFWIERILFPRLEIETGLRYDLRKLSVFYLEKLNPEVVSQKRNNENLSFSVYLLKKISPSLSIGLHSASAWKPALVNELFSNGVHHGSATYESGNEKLETEKALNTSLNLRLSKKKYALEANLYGNFIQNYIYAAPTGEGVLTIRGTFPSLKYIQTNAFFKGLDLTSQVSLSKTTLLKTQMSILWADDLTKKQALLFAPANRATVSLIVKPKSLFFDDLSISLLGVMKQKRLPTTNLIDTDSQDIFKILLTNGDYLPPPNAYQLLNATASKEFKIKGLKRINLGISCKNILNTTYRDYLNRFRYFADEIGRNVTFRSQIEF